MEDDDLRTEVGRTFNWIEFVKGLGCVFPGEEPTVEEWAVVQEKKEQEMEEQLIRLMWEHPDQVWRGINSVRACTALIGFLENLTNLQHLHLVNIDPEEPTTSSFLFTSPTIFKSLFKTLHRLPTITIQFASEYFSQQILSNSINITSLTLIGITANFQIPQLDKLQYLKLWVSSSTELGIPYPLDFNKCSNSLEVFLFHLPPDKEHRPLVSDFTLPLLTHLHLGIPSYYSKRGELVSPLITSSPLLTYLSIFTIGTPTEIVELLEFLNPLLPKSLKTLDIRIFIAEDDRPSDLSKFSNFLKRLPVWLELVMIGFQWDGTVDGEFEGAVEDVKIKGVRLEVEFGEPSETVWEDDSGKKMMEDWRKGNSLLLPV